MPTDPLFWFGIACGAAAGVLGLLMLLDAHRRAGRSRSRRRQECEARLRLYPTTTYMKARAVGDLPESAFTPPPELTDYRRWGREQQP